MIKRELGSVCSRLSSGKSIRAENINPIGAYPVIGGNGLRGYTDSYNFDGECAVIGRQGAACGNVRYHSGKAYMTEHAVVVCANDENDTRYLSYLLSIQNLGRLSAQSAQPGISVKTLSKQEVFLPPLDEQKRVSQLLGTIDSKINANTKLNDYLERCCQSLFDDIQNDRTNEAIQLSDVAAVNPKRHLTKGSLARCVGMANLSTSGSFPNDWCRKAYSGGMKFMNGDTILARITPCLENGKTAYINFLDEGEVAFGSTEYIVLASKGLLPAEFFYFLARNRAFVSYATNHMNGSSGRQRVSAQDIEAYRLRMPSSSQAARFADFARPIMEEILTRSLENRRLSSLRDALLPKLLSGEVDVSKVEIPTPPNNHLCDH